ncbi:MAG: hypothetical protein DRI37_10375 [Chloroflexi bacterium]|nr:MAG: hypothetical protein DRI37_10375 [Chloroflexota bacterium]
MKGTPRKLIVGVTALFISLAFYPLVMGISLEEKEDMTTIEYTTVDENGKLVREYLTLPGEQTTQLVFWIIQLLKLLERHPWDSPIIQFFLKDHPLLQKIFSYLLSSNILNKKLVASLGWGRCFNPFKEVKTAFIKPLVFWHYANAVPEGLPIPSTTLIMDLNPFKLTTFKGFQLGLLLKFRGVYVHIPRPLPELSMTFFIGTAKQVWGVAFPLPEIPSQS